MTAPSSPRDVRILAVVHPGETVSYVELIDRLKAEGIDTGGVGMDCHHYEFRGHTGAWRGSEVVSYRIPYFDYENEGNWIEGQMFVTRRPEDDA